MKKNFYSIIVLLLAGFQLSIINCQLSIAQSVSVSPSRFYFKAAPGETKKQVLHVTNTSPNRQSFTISFGDFSVPGIDGKTKMLKAGESEHSCSNYMSASPSFFELDS